VTPLRSDAARNRSLLLDVARRYVAAGQDLPPLATLAAEAGLGTGTVYRHFPSVTAVLTALGVSGMRAVVTAARAAAEHEDPARGLAEVIGFVVRGACVDPGVAAMLDPGDGCAPPPLVAELGTVVDTLMTRATAAGAVRPDLDADDVRRLVLGVTHALRTPPAITDDAVVDRYVEVLVAGLAAPTV
jgi:AcrR family transcriptional regulator